jgi:hypothetical protein
MIDEQIDTEALMPVQHLELHYLKHDHLQQNFMQWPESRASFSFSESP